MCKASFTFSWTGLAALSSTLAASQSTWCCWSHWCSAMADFHVSPLLHALIAPALHPLHPAAWARKRSSHTYKSTTLFAPRFTFALRMTRASSRNVSKFYRTVKLSEKNLRLFIHYCCCPTRALLSLVLCGGNVVGAMPPMPEIVGAAAPPAPPPPPPPPPLPPPMSYDNHPESKHITDKNMHAAVSYMHKAGSEQKVVTNGELSESICI